MTITWVEIFIHVRHGCLFRLIDGPKAQIRRENKQIFTFQKLKLVWFWQKQNSQSVIRAAAQLSVIPQVELIKNVFSLFFCSAEVDAAAAAAI